MFRFRLSDHKRKRIIHVTIKCTLAYAKDLAGHWWISGVYTAPGLRLYL